MRNHNGVSVSGTCKALLLLCLIACFSSCEREVDINLDSGEANVVVQGAIENNFPPYVILTKSIGYFSQIDLATLQNNFIHDAVVKVSDGTTTVQLKEYSIDTGKSNKFFFYSIDTAVKPLFLGQFEKYYKLTILLKNGQVYEATTKIPTPAVLDSAKSILPDIPIDMKKFPDARQLRVVFKDPDTLGNCVRYFTQRKGEPFYAGPNSVYNDEIINGTKFAANLALGEPKSLEFSDTLAYGTAKVGDTVILKWSYIDRATYDFWNTYEFSLGTSGSPFSTPINVKSNISNKALGIWAGYGTNYYTIPIKD